MYGENVFCISFAASVRWVLLCAIALWLQSIAIASDQTDGQESISISTELMDEAVFRVYVHNRSDSEVIVYSNRTRPPFFRFMILDRAGDHVAPVSWRGDFHSKDIRIAATGSRYFDVDIGGWFPELTGLSKNRCIDFLWVWNVSIDGFDKPFFFGGAVPLNCDYENRRSTD